MPPPARSEESWRTGEIASILYPEGSFDDPSPESWEVRGVFTDEWAAPMEGYSVYYPTPTDVLMWLRWRVLPAIEVGNAEVMGMRANPVELRGKVKALEYPVRFLRQRLRFGVGFSRRGYREGRSCHQCSYYQPEQKAQPHRHSLQPASSAELT